jgi:alkyl hydroperoxide reductase subunit AhpF
MALFRPDEETAVREHLQALERPVELALVLGPEPEPLPGARDIDFAGQAQALLEELTALSDRLTLTVHDAPALGAEHFPAISVRPEGLDAGVWYYGLPWGYELTSIVGACVEAGRPEPQLRDETKAALAGLAADTRIDVFVTPT